MLHLYTGSLLSEIIKKNAYNVWYLFLRFDKFIYVLLLNASDKKDVLVNMWTENNPSLLS